LLIAASFLNAVAAEAFDAEGKRMLAGSCCPLIAGAQDCVTNEIDAWGDRNR